MGANAARFQVRYCNSGVGKNKNPQDDKITRVLKSPFVL